MKFMARNNHLQYTYYVLGLLYSIKFNKGIVSRNCYHDHIIITFCPSHEINV